MKKLYYLFSLCLLALSACTESSTEATDLELHCTSQSVMNFTGDGGEGVIEYTLTEKATRSSAAKVIATADVDWITIQSIESNRVTFLVAPNESSERSGIITLEYNGSYAFTMVEQARTTMPDKTFVATHLGGSYYGKFIDTDYGAVQTEGFNYHIILSDMQTQSVQSKPEAATEYRFDLYTPECGEWDKEHRIPVGTYTLDHSSSGKAFSIDGNRNCSFLLTGNNESSPYRTATMVVTSESIIVDVKFLDNSVHRVEYYGEPVLEDFEWETFGDINPVSGYTSTIEFDVTDGYMYAYFRGDWFGTGDDVWFMHMIETKAGFSGVYLLFNFIVPKSAGGYENQKGFCGTYTLSDPTKSLEYTFPAGRLRDADGTQLNAWYVKCLNGGIDMTTAAPIMGGTITVTESNGYVTIAVDGVDDANNDIKGSFEGKVYEYDDQSAVNL